MSSFMVPTIQSTSSLTSTTGRLFHIFYGHFKYMVTVFQSNKYTCHCLAYDEQHISGIHRSFHNKHVHSSSLQRITINKLKLFMIQEQVALTRMTDVQSFFGYANFYQHFNWDYSAIINAFNNCNFNGIPKPTSHLQFLRFR